MPAVDVAVGVYVGVAVSVAGTVVGTGTIDLGAGDDVLTLNDGATIGMAIGGGTQVVAG